MKRHTRRMIWCHNDDQLYKSLLCFQPDCMVNSPMAQKNMVMRAREAETCAQEIFSREKTSKLKIHFGSLKGWRWAAHRGEGSLCLLFSRIIGVLLPRKEESLKSKKLGEVNIEYSPLLKCVRQKATVKLYLNSYPEHWNTRVEECHKPPWNCSHYSHPTFVSRWEIFLTIKFRISFKAM